MGWDIVDAYESCQTARGVTWPRAICKNDKIIILQNEFELHGHMAVSILSLDMCDLVGDQCNCIGSSQLFLIATRGWRI